MALLKEAEEGDKKIKKNYIKEQKELRRGI